MANYEIRYGARTEYHGSKEDWAPTKEFIEEWIERQITKRPGAKLPKYFVLVRDVNYATDEKIDGVRTAHYEISTYFGITQYQNAGGGVMFARENPDPWMTHACTVVDMVLPYDWFNPELGQVEPGYIQIRLATPRGEYAVNLSDTEELLNIASELEYGYNHMINSEYPGSRNILTDRNYEAEFSVSIRILPFLIDENARA
jgi:hypothetical protein